MVASNRCYLVAIPPAEFPFALSRAHLQALRAELDKPCGFSSYGEIQQFIAETYQVEMSYKAVYSLVHDKWGAKLKVPRKSHQKKTRHSTECLRFDLCPASRRSVISEKQQSVHSVVLPRRIEIWHFARRLKEESPHVASSRWQYR